MMIDIKGFKMKRMAFTMLELVFVIVVLGILAALAMPRLDRDLRQEAADNILSAIRYTQHLALTDNKHRFNNSDWQKALWQIRFPASGSGSYSIGTNMDYDTGGTNIDADESAIDPSNGKLMHSSATNASPNIDITKKYGINSIVFKACAGQPASSAMHIAFDNLGRPHRGVTQGATNGYATYVNNGNCQITFNSPSFNSSFTIEIKQETGYAHVVGQDDS